MISRLGLNRSVGASGPDPNARKDPEARRPGSKVHLQTGVHEPAGSNCAHGLAFQNSSACLASPTLRPAQECGEATIWRALQAPQTASDLGIGPLGVPMNDRDYTFFAVSAAYVLLMLTLVLVAHP